MKLMIFIPIMIFSNLVQAETMDLETHNTLIEKLEKGKSQSEGPQINLRLADLYSDRARIKKIKEEEQGCNQCLKSADDRKKSLKIYRNIFAKLQPEQKERVFEQISNSYMALGDNSKADKFHHHVFSNKKNHNNLRALAYLAQAHKFFLNQKYTRAYKEYKTALKLNSKLKSPLTQYRMAWCEFNSGKFKLAKTHLAQLLSSSEKIDSQLRYDIARDYAKFTAKGPISQNELRSVHKLSPEDEAKDNVELLAAELDRLGRAHENLATNHYIIENFPMSSMDKAFAYLRMSQAEQTLKRTAKTPESFKKSNDFFKKVTCKKDEVRCKDYEKKARRFIVYWNKVELDNPSQSLLQVMKLYLNTFPEDFDMHFITAQSHHKAKKYSVALNHYLACAQEIKAQEGQGKNSKLFSVALDTSMTMAEESQNLVLRRRAYSQYLEIHPTGPKKVQAKYQLAYLDYEEKKYPEASNGFKATIQDYEKTKPQKKSDRMVAKKAADLVLDILAIHKDNDQIMTHAQTFASQFPEHKKEFLTVYRKALLHKAVALLDKTDEKKEKVATLTEMVKLSFADVPEKEQILLLETQVRLARQVQNLPEMIRSSKKILTYKKLPVTTENFAYDEMIWALEVSFNFKQAYIYAKRRYGKATKSKDQIIKLARLAEMGGINPKRIYEEYLERAHGILEGNRIRAKIVQTSPIPWKEIKDRIHKMKRSPLLLSELALETYARYKNIKGAEHVLTLPNVAKKPSGRILRRHLEIPKFNGLKTRLEKHIISHRSDSRMQKDIAKRMTLLADMEAFANEAIERKDFPIQIASLSVLQLEKERLARDLKNLPLPKGLTGMEQKQYKAILSGKIQTIAKEAYDIAKSMQQSWKQESYLAKAESSHKDGSFYIQKLLAVEAQFLKPYTPKSKQRQISTLLKTSTLSQKDLNAQRSKAKQNPFEAGIIKSLREFEQRHNNNTHVAFLDQRLLELQGKVTP